MTSMRRTAFVVGLGLVLAGCGSSSTTTTYATQAAQSLQQRVLAIATSANTHDYAQALQQLTALQQADDAALAAGSITNARRDAIAASISQVRADLTSLQRPTPTPPSPPPTKHHKQHGNGDGNGGNDNGGD